MIEGSLEVRTAQGEDQLVALELATLDVESDVGEETLVQYHLQARGKRLVLLPPVFI